MDDRGASTVALRGAARRAHRHQIPQAHQRARGAVIEDVAPGGEAEAAGLRASDVILEVNHRSVRDAADATGALRQARDARVVFLLISRRGMQMFVSMRQP